MIVRGQNFNEFPINIVGSSIFGRYPKINVEKTYNMFISDNFLVPYAGYKIALTASYFNNGIEGRGIFSSTKLKKLIIVIGKYVFLVDISFNQNNLNITNHQLAQIGILETSSGIVYISENNKPQIAISDGNNIYIYDPSLTPSFKVASTPNFVPGYITFHDTYFLCAASQDNGGGIYSPPANNTWRLSGQNDGLSWPDLAANIGFLQTKPDNTQAVVRFPSKGNMILVLGQTVGETWFDTGAQLFPYQRQNQTNFDYGCLSPATVAYMDEIIVWLAYNEKSGPIVMYSTGGSPEKITTDGFDYLFSNLSSPQDSQGFLFRQDGHLFYQLNFYSDNLSIVYDFNTQKIYHACDQNLNYFIARQVAFFDTQYYFISKNTGNLYAFDTQFTTYQDTDSQLNIINYEIPRFRICKNIRLPSQQYFISNDIGFTIESGETNYQQQDAGSILLITEDGNNLITDGNLVFLTTEDNKYLLFENGNNIVSEQTMNVFPFLQTEQDLIINTTPRVDLSISIDGGASFGSDFPYILPPIGKRKNRLMWWNLGISNDMVCQFKFWSIGRFVATDGIMNVRK